MRSWELNHLKTIFFEKISFEDTHASMGSENGSREGGHANQNHASEPGMRVLR